jgi:hypothetical protein
MPTPLRRNAPQLISSKGKLSRKHPPAEPDPKVEKLVREIIARVADKWTMLKRTVYPVIPPRVEYELTTLGRSLSAAFCGVWLWAEAHHDEITRARVAFREHAAVARR